MKDNISSLTWGLSLIMILLVGMIIGCFLQASPSYKRGQLDYQAGKIEWTVIDGKVHNIEAEDE